jgi:hydroxyacylglutathione hydrolase
LRHSLPKDRRRRRLWIRFALGALVFAGLIAATAAYFAPYVDAELLSWLEPHAIVEAAPAKLGKGRMFDDYFAVEDLGHGTFAIGEPRYYQQNYSYLILGDERAVLFDSGSGTRDISKLVATLTRLPLTVIVSHLHYDHFGGLVPFSHVAMIDTPETRADAHGGKIKPTRYEYLGLIDHLAPPSIPVGEWLEPGSLVELGHRSLRILSTPGHTPSSMALYDPANGWLFIGDFIYPTTLYAFLPGASLAAYQATATRLLDTLPPATVLWAAHCCRLHEGVAAPWLTMQDLRDLSKTLAEVRMGTAHATGFYPRVYPVNTQMTLATGFFWNNR